MNVAVLGGGNGGYAMTADLTLKGHKVNMFEVPEFKANIKPIKQRGGIEIGGAAMTGFATPNMVTTDIGEALDGVDVVMVVVPAFGHKRMAELCAPHLEKGQIVALNPGGQFGALEFAKKLMESGVDVINEVTVGETLSLYYACRRYGFAKVWVAHIKNNLPFAAMPSKNNERALNILNKIYPELVPGVSILETSLNSFNAWAHPPLIIFNAVGVEGGESLDDPKLHQKIRSCTAVENVKKAMDAERISIAGVLGLETLPLEGQNSWLERVGWTGKALPWPFRTEDLSSSYRGGTLKMRYLTEDIPYGLVPVASLGDMLDVPTPTLDAIITLASVILQTDYRREGRTVQKLGIPGLSVDELKEYVAEGQLLESG